MRRGIILSFVLTAVLAAGYASVCADEIHEAAKSGNVQRVKELIEGNPDLMYVKDEQGKTALHWATGRSQPAVMKLLIDHRVDINVRNNNGGTPLHVAASQANPDGARLLLQHGAEINARTKDGATPLHFAALKRRPGHLEAARVLLEHKADVNAKMNNGATPLSLALSSRNNAMADLLRQHGGQGSAQRAQGGQRMRMRGDWGAE